MNAPRGGHEKLLVYRVSNDLWIELTRWSGSVRWGRNGHLSSQLLRAAHSTPSNIAEGQARGTNRELIHFLNIAQGSTTEVRHNIKGLEQLGILRPDLAERFMKQAIRVDCMLTKLIRYRRQLEKEDRDGSES
jgi:four helix bundle protein